MGRFSAARLGLRAISLVVGLGLAACETTEGPPPITSHQEWPPHEAGCGRLLPLVVVGDGRGGGGGRAIFQQSTGSLVFLSGLNISANGAPNAYHPDDVSRLDTLQHALTGRQWTGIATDRFGKPFVQGAQDPAPGFFVSVTALTDPEVQDRADPNRYVDSTHVSYIALPGGDNARAAYAAAGVRLGDLGIVYNVREGTIAPAVFADFSAPWVLGQGSIRLAEKLGYSDTSPRHGSVTDAQTLYLIFPGSGLGFPRNVHDIEQAALDHLAKWGEDTRLKDCAERLH